MSSTNLLNRIGNHTQFVAMWQYGGKLWSYTIKVVDGDLWLHQESLSIEINGESLCTLDPWSSEMGIVSGEWYFIGWDGWNSLSPACHQTMRIFTAEGEV